MILPGIPVPGLPGNGRFFHRENSRELKPNSREFREKINDFNGEKCKNI